MKRTLTIIGVIIIAVAGLWGVKTWAGQQSRANPADGAQATPTPADNVIWASGKLVPAQWAGLSPAANGTVRTLHVAEGDRVAAGQLLLELEATTLARQVQMAETAVAEAQAARDKLLAGATPEQIAQADAEVAAAQANVAMAQATVQQSRQAAAAAEAQAGIAQAQYNELASRPTQAEKVAAGREIELASAAVKQAQGAYDRVRGDPEIAIRPEALALEQATIRLDTAKAAYQVAAQGATPQQLAVGQAQVKAAQSQTQVAAGQIPSSAAGVQAAEAQLARAQAALQALKTGPTAEDKALAEVRVRSAQAALAAAQAQLAQTQVVAPFAGQVGSINVRTGEMAVPGQPALMLGDTRVLRVETTDLRETDVTRLKTGMPVDVTFDAAPNRRFQGTIARIAPMSTTEKGSTNYTVVVDVSDLETTLRWGMTAFINIQADH